METASEIAKVNHQIQASGMSCNLREVNLSHLEWIKRKVAVTYANSLRQEC